jgi:hypothetical protein
LIQQIKNILFNDKDKIITVLKKLNCHKINSYYQNQIRCALPDGETGTSVQIILTDFLPAYVYSRSGYDSYEIKDIISLVQFLLKSNFTTAIKWLCEVLGIEYDDTQTIIRNQSETIKVLKEYVRQGVEIPLNNPMNENFLNKYPLYIVKEWVDEGIEEEIQKKYGIRIDKEKSRWLIPIRDKDNTLITVKGRSYLPNTKELDIPKYIHYKENKEDKYCNNILFGLNHNYENIKRLKEVIIVEGEKTVMKASSMGFDNVVAIGGHDINKNIKREILKLQVDVVLALDKDVTMSEIMKEGRKLSMFANVYYVYDDKNLLGKNTKNAPFDSGLGIWLELYDNRKRLR